MYHVLAFYHFTSLPNPEAEVKLHKEFFTGRDITSRIYINEHGINGQMSAAPSDAEAYMEWMKSRPEFKDVTFKVDQWHEQVFPRQTVKYRQKLVAYDREVDLENRGEHLPPSEWKKMLEESKEKVLIDVRNDYEWKLGRFEGAELPECETFRDFDRYAEELQEKVDPKKTPVMMYCTGGIRCELYSAVLKERGFEKVYQLEGGVINYGQKEGASHWLGKLFVFDDRMAVPIAEEEAPVIGKCHKCGEPSEDYYNCANMHCNELFLSCRECLKELQGCCQPSCTEGEHVRPVDHQKQHKPFRKWYNYFGPKTPTARQT
jgi:UPF0176 protein